MSARPCAAPSRSLTRRSRARYLASCVDWPPEDVSAPGGLIDLIDRARPIRRTTFCRRVHPDQRKRLERALGYGPAFPVTRDHHVSYLVSRLHGIPVWVLVHSAIEYVFSAQEIHHA